MMTIHLRWFAAEVIDVQAPPIPPAGTSLPRPGRLLVIRGSGQLANWLSRFSQAGRLETEALADCISTERRFAPREHLLLEGEPSEGLFVIVSGFACRYKIAPDGRRQIIGLLIPGDVCDLRVLLMQKLDYSVCALKRMCTVLMRPDNAATLLERYPRLMREFWRNTAVEDGITREWVVNVGYRTAFERVGHLLCEMFCRLEAVGLARNNLCELPLTQIELGDALALSSVHINRTLMDMRKANLIRLQGGRLELLDRTALEAAAAFNPMYLHLDGGSKAVGGQVAGDLAGGRAAW